jgi:hypothetical protein
VWELVDDLVSGVGDVLAWARRNGAREGTPFFVDPSGRADVLVNAFWRAPSVRFEGGDAAPECLLVEGVV